MFMSQRHARAEQARFHIGQLFLAIRRKLEHRLLMERLPRLQDRAREIRMIRRIRKVLRLQAEAVATFVDVALLSGDRAVEKVSGIELNAGCVVETSSTRPLVGS